MTAFLEWNMGILAVLAEHRTAILDWFFAAFTWLGSEYVVIVAVCLLFLCIDKRLGYRMAFVFFLSSALVQSLKVLCRIDRPWVLAERDYPQYKDRYSPLELLGSKSGATGYSFPSGHTQSSLALYGTLALQNKKIWVKAGLFLVAFLVAFSRLYLGVHTPFDVVVSLFITGGVLLLVESLFDRLYDNPKADCYVAGLVLLMSLAALILGWVLSAKGIAAKKDATDCVKMAACGVGFAIGYVVERRYIRFDPKVGTVKEKALRLLCGVGGVFALKEGLKALGKSVFLPDSMGMMAVDALRYMLMLLFALCVVPALSMKFRRSKKTGKKSTGCEEQ